MNLFIKRKDITSLEFQPLQKESKKVYSIWDNHLNRFYKEGNKVPFTHGEVTLERGVRIPEDEKNRFRWAIGCYRDVLVNGEKRILNLPPSADEMLQRLIDKEEHPLQYTYTVERTGEKLNTKWFVYKGQLVGEVGVDQSRIEKEQDFATVDGTTISEEQATVLRALHDKMRSQDADTSNSEVKKIAVNYLISKGFTQELAEKAYEEHLK